MMKSNLTLAGLLLATSALTAPSLAVAQDAAAAPEEITVRGRYIPDVMRETSEITSVLGEADLLRQGDDTAAAALLRVTGLSLVSSKFVYVRGLGERYSSALLNGSPLPSPEPLQRVVPLDLFPSNVLAGAVVQKTFSPQYPGEFGGGVINLETLNIPSEPFATISGSWGGNTETTQDAGLTHYGGDWDWTGYDDGTRDVPAKLHAAINSGRGRITEANFTPAELQEIGRDFVNAELNLVQITRDVPANWGLDLTGGHSINVGPGQLGVVAVAGYDNSWQTRKGVQQEGEISVANDIFPYTFYDFQSTQNDVVINGLLGLGYSFDEHEVRWTNFYIHSTTKETRSREGFDGLAGLTVRDDFTEWFERQLFNSQLAGDFQFGNLDVSWRGAYAETYRNTPYEKGIRYRNTGTEYLHSAAQEQNYTRFGEVEDQLASAGIDFSYTLPITDVRDAVFSAGYAYSDNDRTSQQREFRFLATNTALPVAVQRERVDFLFSDFNIRPDALVLRETTGGDGVSAYNAALDVHGFYGQADVELIPFVRIAAGARYEDASEQIKLIDLFGGTPPASPSPLENQYLLPAATVTWNFYEDMQLRLGYSQTIARPQFRELAPQVYFDPDTDRQYVGNPFLLDTEFTNYDARLEWYFGANQFVALSAFYKDIEKPVELIVNEQGASLQTTFINAPKATLIGGEFEVRKYFEMPFGTEWMQRVTWFGNVNYTYTQAEVEAKTGDVVFAPIAGGLPTPADIYVQDGDPLQGQSEHLANVQFGFEDDELGLQATVLANYSSERITTRGRPGHPDLVIEPGVLLDFTSRWTVANTLGGEATLGFEARNLLGEEYDEFQTLGTGTVHNQQYKLGTSFSLSVALKY